MEKEDRTKKEASFGVTLFTVMDFNGIIRNDQGPPWNDTKAITEELKRITKEKITLMGRKTYESFSHEIMKDLSLMNFVITNKTGYKLKKEHAGHVKEIRSISMIQNTWWLLEEKFKEQKRLLIEACRKVQNDTKKKIAGVDKKLTSSEQEDKALIKQLDQTIQHLEQELLLIIPEIVVLGGISLYKEMIDYANIICAILVNDEFKGSESFPLFFNPREWDIAKSVDSKEKNTSSGCAYTSVIYRRKNPPPKYLFFFRPDLPPLPM